MDLKEFIRAVPDFPQKGILFRDITPLLMNVKATQYAVDCLAEKVGSQSVDKVLAMESRGFFFGLLLAQRLGVGFVPVRKPNKLPHKTLQVSYELEYGTDTLEVHEDALSPGDRIVVHDDVLATGGTAEAVKRMVELQGAHIVQFNFLMELQALKGRNRLSPYGVEAVLSY